MLFRRFTLIIFYLFAGGVHADDLEMDTLRLKEITIHGQPYQKFSPGSVIQRSDSIERAAFQAYNLNDLISFRNPVYFKSYGSGMLSTVSFRGTGASHTAVLWNGVNVNQPTLGQSDFSLFPVLAFDDIQVVYGASSSRFGSDAIGGGILLESVPHWDRKLSGSAAQFVGSFGNYLSAIKLEGKVGNAVYLSGNFYRRQNENDFKFKNITRPGEPVERQENASIFQYGYLQDLFIQTSDRSQLTVKGWFNFSDREIQPTMARNSADDSQKDKNLRIVADYGIQSGIGYFELKGAWLLDYMLYNDASEIQTTQQIAQLTYENAINDWEFRLGASFNHVIADVAEYESKVTENRSDLYGGVVNHSFKNTQLSLNVRQTFVPGFKSPFSPSLGGRYRILEMGGSTLNLAGQVSLNYRIPTLNDRYWVPGGRQDLKPEYSRNLDMSVEYHYNGLIDLETVIAPYYYRVDDWIMWVPGPAYWVPENIRQVDALGVDLSVMLKFTTGALRSEINGNYGLSRSVVRMSSNEDDVGIGNQLPYTPIHISGIEYRGIIKSWYGGFSVPYTGKRYVTADNGSEVPAFILLNLRAGKNFYIKKQLLNIDFRVNNILNTSYQNLKFRAMPGRNYLLGVHFMFNK